MTGRHYGIAKALASQGHEVHTIMWDLPQIMSPKQLLRHLFTSLFTKESAYEDLTLHKIGRLPLFWPYINGWLFYWQLKRIYKRIGADMIFAQSYTNETKIPKNLPFVYDLADDYAAFADVYGSTIYKIAFKVLGVRKTMRQQCQNALAVTAVSDILCDYARPYNDNVTKLPNGVESDIISTVQTNTAVRPHSLIYVSGFGPWSQPLKVMQAVVDLRQDFPDLSLTLVGEGSEVVAMEQFIVDHDAASFIDYRGFIHDRREVFTLIQQHEIGINLSEKNDWRDAAHPMKVIEYSALNKKIVSTNLKGVEALHLPNVFMFSNDSDNKSLTKALRKALAAPKSSYANVGKSILAEYSWDTIIRALVRIFDTAIEQQTQPSVTHVTPSYPPALGGLEKVVQVLAVTQAKAGLSVSVMTSGQNSRSAITTDTIPVRRFNSFILANTTIMFGLLPALLRLPKGRVVHLHITQAFTPEVVWLASIIRRCHYIAHVHLDVDQSGRLGFLLDIYKRLFLRRVLRRAAYVLVFTKDQKNVFIAKYGLLSEKVIVTPNGVEDKFYYDQTRKLHSKPRLLFVGRLGYQKNLPQLLDALDGISDKFETTIIGNGPDAVALKNQAKKLKLQNVQFVGRKDGDALLEAYRQADIFVLPSEREGMPLVLLEAMAMGLPIVATDVTGTRDVVQSGKNGLLVPFGDETALRQALVAIADDPKKYASMSQSAQSMAKLYSWQNVSAKTNKLYKMT